MESEFLNVCIHIAYAFLALALAFACYRLYRGPDLTDRVTALDSIAGISLGFALVLSVESNQEAFKDLAIAIAVVGFLGTVALARLIERRALDL
ncbi:MAG: monovalent cation/H+ antiporter complex subunit F [Opitutales bacterium]